MKISAPTAVPDAPAPAAVDPLAPPIAEALPGEEVAPPLVVMAKWPDWFKPVDTALAILAVLLAFLLASYTARNADIWRHLGTGRLILQGNHPIGGDPLSYTGADRAWVNSNWIFDIILYVAYSVDDTGATAVALKALAFAAAFAVLFLLRRPEQSLWPWAMVAGCGAVACGSLASLRPFVFGILLQSVVLVLLYRGNWNGNKWRMPAILGGVCWLWACTDAFFFLGPLTVLLVWGGEKIHNSLTAGQEAPEPADDPFWSAPAELPLLRALALCIAGVLLNPMFLGALVRSPIDAIEQLVPFELTFGWGDVFSGDKALTSLILSPMSEPYYEAPERAYNITGIATLVVVVGSGLLLGGGFSRLRATHVLLWFALVALAVLHYRFIPFAVIAGIPLAAAHLNGLSRYRLQGVYDSTTKLILNSSGVGRIVSIALLVASVAATIPGYLHAPITTTLVAYNRRVSWGIEEEVGLSRGAKLIQEWRAEGGLPPESRGLLSFYDTGDYCAWFAPSEKVFLNSRFRFHGPELVDLAAIRDEFRPRGTEEETQARLDEHRIKTIADKYRADYFVLGQWNQRVRWEQIFRVIGEFEVPGKGSETALLHLDGRVSILCRTDTPTGRATRDNLPYTPEREAFAASAPAIPSGKSIPPLVPVDSWLADFTARYDPSSVATDDAMLFLDLARKSSAGAQNNWLQRRQVADVAGIGAGPVMQWAFDPGPRLPNPDELAYALLAQRAARRAIFETPDDPEPHAVLADTYTLSFLGALDNSETKRQQITGRRRFLDRAAVSPNGKDGLYQKIIENELALFLLHIESGQLDLALDVLAKTNAAIKNAPDDMVPPAPRLRQVRDAYRRITAETIISKYLQGLEFEGRPQPSQRDLENMYSKLTSEVLDPDLDPGETREKMKPKDAAWVKARTQTLEDRLRRDIGKRSEAFNTETKNAGITQKFMACVERNLIGRAMDLIFSESDWESVPQSGLDIRLPGRLAQVLIQRFGYLLSTAEIRETNDGFVIFRTSAIGLNLQAISLQLESGQLDKAAQQLTNVSKVLEKAEQDNTNDARLAPSRAAYNQLRTIQARLEGDFDKVAEDTREKLRQLPKVDPEMLEYLKKPPVDRRVSIAAVAGGPMQFVDPVIQYRVDLVRESLLHYDLGLTALQAGDNREARKRFAESLKPQGVPVAYLNVGPDDPMSVYATRYLALLDKFAVEKPAK